MRGGLNNNPREGAAYATATSTTPATSPDQTVTDREALRIAGVSLTMEELLAFAVLVNAVGTLAALYLEVTG